LNRQHVYVWYRIDADATECDRHIRGMMARLACRTGVAGQLLQRCDDPSLWMEVYSDVGEATVFCTRLRQAVDEYEIEMFIDGARHVECFTGEALPAPRCGTAPEPT